MNSRTPYKYLANSKASQVVADDKESVIVQLASKDYLFSQVSICSSISTEMNSHLIQPETAQFINSNGEGWTNDSLAANYKSYIGGWNYVNHVQVPEESVGFLADAALRRRYIDEKRNLFVYYVDLLVATHRDHKDLVEKIMLKEIQFLSMGCSSYLSTCSRCGEPVMEDSIGEPIYCEHLEFQKGKYFFDDKGVRRITAELLGTKDPGTVVFEEASWLTQPPAFGGAAMRNILPVPADCSIELQIPKIAMDRDAIKKYLGK